MPLDAAIIGAGPAGTGAARFLALWGHRVALLGRAPARRSLAESLPPSCTKLFDQLGVRDEIDSAGFVRATGNTVLWAGSLPRAESFGAGERGYQVDRGPFDALLKRAALAAGAEVFENTTVRAVERSGDETWRVEYDADGNTGSLDAKWVLDCTGRAGLLARRGLRRAEPGGRTMALVGVWERDGRWNVGDESHTIVESY